MEAQELMDSSSSHASGHCQECQPALPNAASGAKRLLDSAELVQAPQSPKKTCVSSQPFSTPDPSEKLLLYSSGSASCQGSSHFLGDSGCDGPVDSPSVPNCDGDVAVSLDTSGCFDESEPDDSLLELSDSEEENSPFDYAEEEIQKILADDFVESEQDPTGTSALSQSGSEESKKDEGNSSSEASVTSEDASVVSESPDEALSRASSSISSEGYPSLLLTDSTEENYPQVASCTFFDLDIQELLVLNAIDADCEDELLEESCWEEAGGVASEVIRSKCPEFDNTTSSRVLEESSEVLVSEGQQNLGVDCLGKTHSVSHDGSSSSGDHEGRSMPSSGLACGQHTADRSSSPLFLRCPTPSSGSRQQELCRERRSWFSTTLGSQEEQGDSAEAEQPSGSVKLRDTGVGHTGQEVTTSGKKPGKVIPVLQEEERPTQRLEQHLYPECARPHEEGCGSYMG
ncbi:uncharacterized protein LOC128854295 [Cuculus canorus]|uniref:uncharacterized protein LOC128854295 n=1 Tax=Cuculus canorus TaxID=55661 RepID=UPI0023AB390C|nr:uncharacterized protein LOC128854295 [Cuculus canorus]XP_053942433.1 uncharacterized protein LOC128854295 [Cuculus canorus]